MPSETTWTMVLIVAALTLATLGCGDETEFREVNGCELKPGAVCIGADLSGAAFGGVDLSSADMRQANFTASNLAGVNFTGAELQGADFSRANLRGAILRGANLDKATLNGADLTDATLQGATITPDTTLNTNTIFSNTTCPGGGNSDDSPTGTCQPPERP